MEITELNVGDEAVAFSTFRGEGCTDNSYAGFNVCHYTGDEMAHVETCRAQLADFISVTVGNLLIPRQTHSINVAEIDDDVPSLEDVDAMVTSRDDVALVVNTADCLPIVFNDSSNGIIGIAHGGWRGVYGGIIGRCVDAMVKIGAERREIRAAIGPSICADCYEVDEEFAERFVGRFGSDVKIEKPGAKPHVDLRVAAVKALLYAGIDRSRIEVCELCSRCDTRLFSARRMGILSGRIATIIKKKNKI